MNRKIRFAFLALIVLQALHSAEEFTFKFYERFPPMQRLYQATPQLAKPAFAIANSILILIGLGCFFYWVWPARKGARSVVRSWMIIESLNAVAHVTWALRIRAYDPGLVTAILFAPVLVYLGYLMTRPASPAT